MFVSGSSASGSRAVKALAALTVFGFAASSASAAVLAVDFGSTTNVSTETGFQPFGVVEAGAPGPVSQSFAVADPSVTSGSITVTLANGSSIAGTGVLLARNRGAPADSGAFTYGELYRDLAIANPSNTTLQLQLAGLNPSTQYDVTLYAYDPNNGGTVTLTDVTTGAPGTVQSYTYAAGSVTANEQYGRTFRVTSTVDGTAAFTSTTNFNSSQGLLNGFQISAVPEPASAAVVGV
ncbi:MAG TPA: hypothetical protein VF796_29405, partial [Humisphaera sp.]